MNMLCSLIPFKNDSKNAYFIKLQKGLIIVILL
jgi:hypothetical protein